MSDTNRKHLKPKAYRTRRAERSLNELRSGLPLKTNKQRRAADRRALKKEI